MAGLIAALLQGCAPATAPQDLRGVKRARAPIDALACPPGLCAAEADIETPRYPISPQALSERIEAIAAAEPRTEPVERSEALMQRVFVQRTQVLNLPDTIWAQVVALPGEEEAAGLILYSRSNVGYWDIGVNRARVERWLEKLASGQ